MPVNDHHATVIGSGANDQFSGTAVVVRDGEVMMATNYGLEPWEVEKGFVLACQSRPVSDSITLDYDKI